MAEWNWNLVEKKTCVVVLYVAAALHPAASAASVNLLPFNLGSAAARSWQPGKEKKRKISSEAELRILQTRGNAARRLRRVSGAACVIGCSLALHCKTSASHPHQPLQTMHATRS